MPFHLRPATEADLPGIGRTLVASYREDLLTRVLFPPHLRWHRPDDPDHFVDEETPMRTQRFAKRMRAPGTFSLVVEDDAAPEPAAAVGGATPSRASGSESDQGGERGSGCQRRIVGVAQYVGPEIGMDGSVHYVKEAAEAPLVEAFPRSFDATKYPELVETLFKSQAAVFGEENMRRMWYLYILGVDPEYQRRGVGGMLVDWGIEQAKLAKTDCFLEASALGHKLYSNRGFEVVSELYLWGEGPFPRMVWRGREEKVPYGKLPTPEAASEAASETAST